MRREPGDARGSTQPRVWAGGTLPSPGTRLHPRHCASWCWTWMSHGLGTQDFSTTFPCAHTQECTDGSTTCPLSSEWPQLHAAGLKNPAAARW